MTVPTPSPPEAIPRTPSWSYRFGRVVRLAQKELTEVLRDRRTIVTLAVMPLLLYPLLVLAFQALLSARPRPACWIGLPPGRAGLVLRDYLERGRIALAQQSMTSTAPGEEAPGAPEISYFELENPESDVENREVDIAFRARAADEHAGRWSLPRVWEVVYRQDSVAAREALPYLERVWTAAHADVLEEQLRLRVGGHPERPRLTAVPLATASGSGRWLSVFVPLVLILMTMTGAVYPAIDLTAGERERGTLEILIAAPIPRISVLLAKYVAVVAVAVLTAVVNLGAMTVSVLLTGLGETLFGPGGISAVTILEIFGLVILFAAFFAAVLLVVTSFARSFKEAQAYLIPLMLVSIAPGLLALAPRLSLNGPLALVPLLNIVLLSRDLLDGQAHPGAAAVVIGATALYAFLAIVLAARLFGAEAVLYSESGIWRYLFPRQRRRALPRPTQTLTSLPEGSDRG